MRLEFSLLGKPDEEGWTRAKLDFRSGDETLLVYPFALTIADLRVMSGLLQKVCHQTTADLVEFASTDEDFVFVVGPSPRPDQASLGFWVGEPYQVQHGFRVIVTCGDLEALAMHLASESAQ
jgi:hypothetical protein